MLGVKREVADVVEEETLGDRFPHLRTCQALGSRQRAWLRQAGSTVAEDTLRAGDKKRLPLVKRRGGVAGPKVLRGGPLQGIKHGATLQGVNDTILEGARRMIAAAHGGV